MNEVTPRSDNVGANEMAADDADLGKMISIRVSKNDLTAMKRLAKRMPMLKPITIARIALRIGFDALSKDPSRMFDVADRDRSAKKRTTVKPKRKRGA